VTLNGQDTFAEMVIVALCVIAMIAMLRFGARRLALLLIVGGTVAMAVVLTLGHGAEAFLVVGHMLDHSPKG
jgi:hypothetical protein